MAMFVIYFINMQSLTQTNAFLTPALHSHLQDTNVLMCLNLESRPFDILQTNIQSGATFAISL